MNESSPPSGWARWLRRLVVAATFGAALYLAAWPFQADPVDPVPFFAEQEVTITAHRGASGHVPENTVAAFDTALAQGADVLEMDLQLTADGEVVVLHDATVDRTTDGTGLIHDLTLDEVQALDAGYYFEDEDGAYPYRGEDITIPTLRAVLDRYPDTPLLLEMKTDSGDDIIQAVADALAAAGRSDAVMVGSFSTEYLKRFRDKKPDIPTHLGMTEALTFYGLHLVGLHRWYRAAGEALLVPPSFRGLPVATPLFIRAAGHLGLEVHMWTINDPDEMAALLERGVDGVLTDYPDRAAEVVSPAQAARAMPADDSLVAP